MDLPRMIRIRQNIAAPVLQNIPQHIASQIDQLALEKRTRTGQTVAVACSSRGIANYDTIVKATVRSLQRVGLEPFIVPAMGSHGAATAEGQKRVLQNYGISDQEIGVPVRSSLEVVQIGETADHIPVFLDKVASEADHIVLINRIKTHTDFEYEIESGLMKLMVIGLGKQQGASVYHQGFLTYGYPHVIESVARTVLQTGRILFGVGVVENGCFQTAEIGVIAPEDLEEKEKNLLRESKKLAAHLPFDDVDVLIIDEMGKDISGSGFDTKVVGRINQPLLTKDLERPRVKRIVVCDLTKDTEGNADGVGSADFVTQRLVDKINIDALYMNAITGLEPERGRIPVALKNDREAIEIAIRSVGLVSPEELKVIRIKNTLCLAEVETSEAYGKELSQRSDLHVMSQAKPLGFDQQGNLLPF